MKPPYVLVLCTLFLMVVSCAPFKNPPDKTRFHQVTGSKQLTFETNEAHKKHKRKKNQYLKSYIVQVFNDQFQLENVVYLPRKGNWKIQVPLDNTKTYFLAVYKDPTFGTFTQIGWSLEGTVSIDKDQATYYASRLISKVPPLTRTITSKNGGSGDGVKVLID